MIYLLWGECNMTSTLTFLTGTGAASMSTRNLLFGLWTCDWDETWFAVINLVFGNKKMFNLILENVHWNVFKFWSLLTRHESIRVVYPLSIPNTGNWWHRHQLHLEKQQQKHRLKKKSMDCVNLIVHIVAPFLSRCWLMTETGMPFYCCGQLEFELELKSVEADTVAAPPPLYSQTDREQLG